MPNTKGPQQVVIDTEAQEPVPVVMAVTPQDPANVLTASQIKQSPDYVTSGQGTVAAPTATEEQQIVTAGQRRINIIWEVTQAFIALAITGAIVYVSINGIDSPDLANAFFVIIGFYYSRVNHQAIGGVGAKPAPEPYRGR